MRKLGAFAGILLVFAVAAASDASARVLLVDSEMPPNQSPTSNNSSQNDLSRSVQNPDTKSSQILTSDHSSNTTEPKASSESGSHRNPPPPSGSNTNSPVEVHTADPKSSVGSGNPANKTAETSSGSHEPRETGTAPADKGKKEGGREAENPIKSGSPTDKPMKDRCLSSSDKCVKEDLIACLQGESTKFLLVQNTGEDSLNVTVKTTQDAIFKSITLPRNEYKEVKLTGWSASDIIISAGKGDCSLNLTRSTYNWRPFQQLPTMTPIYGAYFFLFTIVLAAGAWACCKFKKGRRHDPGVPYQQLEMGAHLQTSSAVEDGITASRWDDGWDDDWDDEEAVGKPSKEHQSNGVSSIGVTSRAPNKDGWDVDWDD